MNFLPKWPTTLVSRFRLAAFVCVFCLNIFLAFLRFENTVLSPNDQAQSRPYGTFHLSEPSRVTALFPRREIGPSNSSPSLSAVEWLQGPETLAIPPAFSNYYAQFVDCLSGDPPQLSPEIVSLLQIPPKAVEQINHAYVELFQKTVERDIAVMQVSGKGGNPVLSVGQADNSAVTKAASELGTAIGESINNADTANLIGESFLNHDKIRDAQRVPPGQYAIERNDYTRQDGEEFSVIILTPQGDGASQHPTRLNLEDPIGTYLATKAGLLP